MRMLVLPGEAAAVITTPCPRCGYRIEESTGLQKKKIPEFGDWSICLNCDKLLVFTEELAPRCAIPEEEAGMEDDVRDIVSHAQLFIRERGRLH